MRILVAVFFLCMVVYGQHVESDSVCFLYFPKLGAHLSSFSLILYSP
jgi:hypothetical protein